MRRQRVRKNRTLRVLEPVHTPGGVDNDCPEPQQVEPLVTTAGTEGLDGVPVGAGRAKRTSANIPKIGQSDLQNAIEEAERELKRTYGMSRTRPARATGTGGNPRATLPGGNPLDDAIGFRRGQGEGGGDGSGHVGSSSRFPRRGHPR